MGIHPLWTGQVAHIHRKFYSQNSKVRHHLGNLGVGGKIILK